MEFKKRLFMNKTSQSSCYCLAGIFNFTHSPVFVYAILYERGETSINRYDNP